MSISKKLLQAASAPGSDNLYVEDVFSTYLYDGTATTQVITNGLDLAGEGGMVWFKNRTAVDNNALYDTERGAGKVLFPDTSGAQLTNTGSKVDFNADGFDTGESYGGSENGTGKDIASWSFREAEKFFDVVTWTGNGVAGREIAHNLGSVPAVIITKRYDAAGAWWTVYHKDSPNSVGWLNEDNAFDGNDMQYYYGNGSSAVTPTSSVFTVSDNANVNGSAATYVAYLFASDAGGFGADGSESVVKCGTFTTDSLGKATVTLGWEPQYFLVKSTAAQDWEVWDTMRDLNNTTVGRLRPNLSSAEDYHLMASPTATGIDIKAFSSSQPYIYVAIRRPMKTPESGTEVFNPLAYTGDGAANRKLTTDNLVDLGIVKKRSSGAEWVWDDRLRGANRTIYSSSSSAESTNTTLITGLDYNDGLEIGTAADVNSNGGTYINYSFTRATGFMDVVAFDGNTAGTYPHTHNLTVVPELIILKARGTTGSWETGVDFTATGWRHLYLNETNAGASETTYATNDWHSAQPTATTFSTGGIGANTHIAYLFATLAGVSKVGSYTGTGADLNVDCGFSAGARFVMIKRTDAAASWYVWDTVRGITAGLNPLLQINDNAAEWTPPTLSIIEPLSSGFIVTSDAGVNINASGGTYIFLAIA
tara:strand:- start:23 stop:1969 length:1947 start_codon:yes stop_codon:yes gene_type:complete